VREQVVRIQVARLAGLPASVVDRARDILKNLESAEYNEYGLPTLAGARAARESGDAQMELFSRRARGTRTRSWTRSVGANRNGSPRWTR